jgi:hypothetical protein
VLIFGVNAAMPHSRASASAMAGSVGRGALQQAMGECGPRDHPGSMGFKSPRCRRLVRHYMDRGCGPAPWSEIEHQPIGAHNLFSAKHRRGLTVVGGKLSVDRQVDTALLSVGGSPMTAPAVASGPPGRAAQREVDRGDVRRGAAPARHVGASSSRPAVALPGRLEGRCVLLRRCIAVLPSHSGRRLTIVFGLIGRPASVSASDRKTADKRPEGRGQCLSRPPPGRMQDALRQWC